VTNGGFEVSGSWTYGGVTSPARYSSNSHTGTYSLKVGNISAAQNGDSNTYQAITIPAGTQNATLTFWYWPASTDTISSAWQEVQIRNASGTKLAQVLKVCSNTQTWTQVSYDLSAYKGQTIQLYFNDHASGGSNPTYFLVDDVSLLAQ
jgi:hypothetical protein